MKAPKVFAVVLVGHLLALSLLFVQQGCQTVTPEERAERTRPTGPGDVAADRSDYEPSAEPAPEEEEREAPQRSAPMRPGSGGVADIEPVESEPVDDPAVADDEGVLSPLPDDGWEDWEEDEEGFGTDDEPVATRTYTVQSGDSIWNIAQRENVSMNDLLDANNLTRESIIQPGQDLQIPESSGGGAGSANGGNDRPEPVDPPEGSQTYTVQRGDSLSVIAERYDTTVAELKSLNNLEGDTIRIGQELVLPEGGSAQPSTGDSGASASTEPEELPDGIRHTVSSGESPGSIASRYGVSVDELMQANNISDPRRMRTGQVLVIPGTEDQAGEEDDDDGAGDTGSTEEETESSEDEPLQVVPDEPEEMEFIEDEEEEDGDVPFVPIVPDDE